MEDISYDTVPQYAQTLSAEKNFSAFYSWALGLKNPAEEIPKASEALHLPVKLHPLGFTVCYLSLAYEGIRTPEVTGLIRANIYPANKTIEPDIHAHGFSSLSGVVIGELTSYFYDEADIFNAPGTPDGEGWTAYENTTDAYGNNHSAQLTDAVIATPKLSRTVTVSRGETYTQQPGIEYHQVTAEGLTITIFAKSVSKFDENGSRGIVLRPPGHTPPPEQY